MKKDFQCLFTLGEPNINNIIYDPETFMKELNRAVEIEVPVMLNNTDDPQKNFVVREQVGKLTGVKDLEIGKIPTVTMEITSQKVIDLLEAGVEMETTSVSIGKCKIVDKQTVADIEEVQHYVIYPKNNMKDF